MNRSKIKKIIENSWKKFCKYYDSKASKYSKSIDNKERSKSHWICWNESDLMIQFGRFFYGELDRNSNIEMHSEKNLTPANFGNYSFKDKLKKLKKDLGWFPKVDLIITPEDSTSPFLICGEAKYFHCSVRGIARNTQTPEGVIKKDFKKLLKIKDLGIAENVIFIIFDDYYYLNELGENKKIKNLLDKYNKKIKILYYNSRVKLQ